eukprot:TRINITY_DN93512_c0_g1_i1.p1 TRINITY_DN93512_c0_g1~~TRINITY_DN93512_c0_g1_i1.p1  ORF type:complete len:316 (-),score=63.44 TRINITY_DN93512_c0_g1_i1:287-1210(-)
MGGATVEKLAAAPFLEEAGALLESDPVMNQIALGVASAACALGAVADDTRDFFVIRSEPGGYVVGAVAIDASTGQVRGSLAGTVSESAVHNMLQEYGKQTRAALLHGMCGNPTSVSAFAKVFSEHFGCKVLPGINAFALVIYEAPPLPEVAGSLRALRDGEEVMEALVAWHRQFVEDALSQVAGQQLPSREESLNSLNTLAAAGHLFVWEEKGEPRAMLAIGRRLGKHGASLSLVFTDRQHRGRGFAKAAVASLCAEKLKTFQFLALFADSRPEVKTCQMYESLGFQNQGLHTQLLFKSDPAIHGTE